MNWRNFLARETQAPGRGGFLFAALVAALVAAALLMSARFPGSALSYSGGVAANPPYRMSSSWAPTLAAASDEFTTDTSASWTIQAAGGTGSTVIDLSTTPTVSLSNFGTFRAGWLFVQPESNTGAHVLSKAYTLATNMAIYSRYLAFNRAEALNANDGEIGIGFAATSGGTADLSNMVYCSPQASDGGIQGRNIVKVQAGVVTRFNNGGSGAANAVGSPRTRTVTLIQKRSTGYHCYDCLDSSGSCAWIGSMTWGGVAALDRVMIYNRNTTATTPGPLVRGFDYFRIVEADNVFP